MYPEPHTLAAALYDWNNLEELEDAIERPPNQVDMKAWGITEQTWREQLEIALAAKREDRYVGEM